jgi:hypothetical protein
MEWSQTCGFQTFDVFDTVPCIPFQPLQWARPPVAPPSLIHWCQWPWPVMRLLTFWGVWPFTPPLVSWNHTCISLWSTLSTLSAPFHQSHSTTHCRGGPPTAPPTWLCLSTLLEGLGQAGSEKSCITTTSCVCCGTLGMLEWSVTWLLIYSNCECIFYECFLGWTDERMDDLFMIQHQMLCTRKHHSVMISYAQDNKEGVISGTASTGELSGLQVN